MSVSVVVDCMQFMGVCVGGGGLYAVFRVSVSVSVNCLQFMGVSVSMVVDCLQFVAVENSSRGLVNWHMFWRCCPSTGAGQHSRQYCRIELTVSLLEYKDIHRTRGGKKTLHELQIPA